MDDIEVPGNHGLAEDVPRLADDLRPEVAVREVGEGEHPDVRGPRDLGGRARRGVARLPRPCTLVVGERAVVYKHVRLVRRLEDAASRRRVAGHDELAATARGPQHLLGPDDVSVREGDGVAALQPPEEGARLHAEGRGARDVEAPGPLALEERVSMCGDAVIRREDEDAVVAALDDVVRTHLHELVRVGELPEDPLQSAEELDEAGRAVNRQGEFAPAQRERLHHPRQAEVVVGVVVGEEDLRELDEPDPRPQELPLRPLAAVDEEALAPAPDQRRSRSAPGCRNRP